MDEKKKKRLGIPPALAGLALYEGLPAVSAPLSMAVTAPAMAATGRPIRAEAGTRLQDLAEFSRDEIKTIRRFARERGVRVPIMAGPESMFVDRPSTLTKVVHKVLGEKLPPIKPHIRLGRASVPIAMHEIGHASPVAGSHALRRLGQMLATSLGAGTAGKVLRGGLLASSVVPPGEDASGARQFTHEHAPALIGASFAPELAEEARASYHALKGARRHGMSTAKTLASLAPGMASYIAGAAVPVAAAIIAKRIVDVLRSDQELSKESQEVQSTPIAGKEVQAPGLLREVASSNWQIGGTPPKPHSTKPQTKRTPNAIGAPPTKLPDNEKYYKDYLKHLHNPQRGYRLAVYRKPG